MSTCGAMLPEEVWDEDFSEPPPVARRAEGKLEVLLVEVRAGRVSFSEMAARTRRVWVGLAVHLHQMWPLPSACGREDVTQELLLAAWRAIPLWDPERANTLAEFVIWQACTAAKVWIHKQRGAVLHGNRGRNRGRFFKPTSAFGLMPDGTPDLSQEQADRRGPAATRVAVEPAQEDALATRRRAEDLAARLPAAAPTRALKMTIDELARDWSPDGAAMRIWSDPDQRRRMRLGNEQAARGQVRRAIEWVARHEGVEAAEEDATRA